MSVEVLLELRARTEAAKASLDALRQGASEETSYRRLGHKIGGVSLVLGYIDDAISELRAAAVATEHQENDK